MFRHVLQGHNVHVLFCLMPFLISMLTCFNQRDDFWNEAIKLADLHHPNVVAFYGVVLDGPGGSVATVTEYMVNGSLRTALQKNERYVKFRYYLKTAPFVYMISFADIVGYIVLLAHTQSFNQCIDTIFYSGILIKESGF